MNVIWLPLVDCSQPGFLIPPPPSPRGLPLGLLGVESSKPIGKWSNPAREARRGILRYKTTAKVAPTSMMSVQRLQLAVQYHCSKGITVIRRNKPQTVFGMVQVILLDSITIAKGAQNDANPIQLILAKRCSGMLIMGMSMQHVELDSSPTRLHNL